uniref:Uncharacterized protein n=1 Tax=Arundo donax TaxID=35708 RepID=A0A0A9FVK5_ARUDO
MDPQCSEQLGGDSSQMVSNVQSPHEDLELLNLVGSTSRMIIQDIGGERPLVIRLINCIFFMLLSVWLRPEARFTFVFAHRKAKQNKKRGGKKRYTRFECNHTV